MNKILCKIILKDSSELLLWKQETQTFIGTVEFDDDIANKGCKAFGNFANSYGKDKNVWIWFPASRINSIIQYLD